MFELSHKSGCLIVSSKEQKTINTFKESCELKRVIALTIDLEHPFGRTLDKLIVCGIMLFGVQGYGIT